MQSNYWKNRPTFVTGASGFLGGWLVRRLLEEGAEVVALLRDGTTRNMLVRDGLRERVTAVHGDLQNVDLLRRALCEYEIQVVFHLAAQPLVQVAKRDPVGTLQANVAGTWNALEAARQSNVKGVVVASSDKAYGASDHLPYLESDPLQGRYPYDVSKSCADLITTMYATTYSLPVTIARCANLFGGGDLNFSRSVPGVIQATLRNEPFVIRSDGKFVRDFIYVEDAAEAYLQLAEALAGNPSLAGEAFNFGIERPLTVLELTGMVLALMGREDLSPIILNQASSEVREQYLSAEKARRMLNWTPRFGLDEGLRRAIAWYSGYFGVSAPVPAIAAAATAGAAR